MLTFGLLFGRLMALFVFQKMAPILGPDGYGVTSLAIDVSAILLIVANFGLQNLITREVARDRVMTLRIMWSALKIRLALGVLCMAGLVLYIRVSGFDALQRDALLIMGLGVFFEASAMACDSVLQAHDRVASQMWGQIVSAVVYLALAFHWLDAGHGVLGVVWANVVSRVVRLAVMVPLMLTRTGPWVWRVPGREAGAASTAAAAGAPLIGVRELLRMGWPLFLATTLGILYYKLDMVLLRALRDETAVGVYGLGHRLLDVLGYAPAMFAVALFPAMVRYEQQGQADFERISERALRYLHLLVLPLSLLCTLAAEPITMWLAKGETGFADSVTVFRITVWGLPFLAASQVLNRMLMTANRERVFISVAAVSLAVNVALNLLLIPRWGYFGASWAVLVTFAVSAGMHWWFVRRCGMRMPVVRSLLNASAALALAWLGAAALARLAAPGWGTGWLSLPLAAGWGPNLALIALTGVLYGGAMSVTRALTPEDWRVIGQLFRRGD
jgi:O-antigen/teichoic acid export membrane protein